MKKFSLFIWILVPTIVGVILSSILLDGGRIIYKEIKYFAVTNKETFKEDVVSEENVNKKNSTPNISHLKVPKFFSNEIIYTSKNTNSNQTSVVLASALKEEEALIQLGWVGDMMPFILKDDSRNIFNDLGPMLQSPDLMMANLEGVLTEKDLQSRCTNNTPNCYSFKGDGCFAQTLNNTGIDLVNLGNNHILDFGKEGYEDTLKILKENDILKTGAQNEITFFEVKGAKIAVLGFSPHLGSASMYDFKRAEETVRLAKKEANIVVVLLHAGGEGSAYLNVKDEDEIYLGKNRGNIKAFARIAIDAGADVVFGSGPHVLRGIEFYKDKPIAYSLGNFLGREGVSTKGLLGISGILLVNINTKGEFVNGKFVSVILDENKFPKEDFGKNGLALVQKLSLEDFEMSGANFDNYGEIKKP